MPTYKNDKYNIEGRTVHVSVTLAGLDYESKRATIEDAISALTLFANTLPESEMQTWVKEIEIEGCDGTVQT